MNDHPEIRTDSPRPPRRVLIAPDKFKGTLTSGQAGRAILRGLRRAWPRTGFTSFALADGGDGFARILTQATGGKLHKVRTSDAAGRRCDAVWGRLGDGRTAVLDLASASGLAGLPPNLRNPGETSTFGTGLVLKRIIASGAKVIIVGLGGSATNDGGVGLASALGWQFLDRTGGTIPLTGRGLLQLHRIIPPPGRQTVRVVAAADVDNPLYGPDGAACQFGPQKGATPRSVAVLDSGLRRLARIARRDTGTDLADVPGACAAGGCGFGLLTFLGAELRPGFDLLCRYTALDELVGRHDLVVTGEGCFDRTSLAGKGPYRLACLARKARVPVWGVFGRIDLPRAEMPFERILALSEKEDASLQSATASTHARRLERGAFRLASGQA